MKKLYCLIIFGALALSAPAQAFYNVTFNNGSFPAGWSTNDARAFVIDNVSARSCCYFSSPTSPEASSFHNVLLQNCAPPGATIMVTVANAINTVGKTNIRVGFGRRATGSWDRPMALEWSSNGTNWNLIDSDVSAGASTSWGSIYYDLPAGADNVANLRFRFSYSTEGNQNCTAAPNFRIDDFTVGSNFSLPTELSRFEAQIQNDQTYISWATASETDNAYFGVEHSADGQHFMEIGKVIGAGTTRELRQYTFWHKNPVAGTNYYRLKQVATNGQIAYSPLRSVSLDGNGQLRVFPSPASDYLQIEWEVATTEAGAWEIYNTMGARCSSGQIASQTVETRIFLKDLTPGLWLLKVRRGQITRVQPFVKN